MEYGGSGALDVPLPLGLLVRSFEQSLTGASVSSVRRHSAVVRRSLIAGVASATASPRVLVEMDEVTAAALSRALVTAIARDESGTLCLDALDVVVVAAGYSEFRAKFIAQGGPALLSTRATAGCARAVRQWRAAMVGDAAQNFHVAAVCFTACHALLREANT